MDILSGLNPQQLQAVTAGMGQTLVLAGPGSGKTRVLTHRIAYLVSQMGVQPSRILAVTFTNKAAREMGERLHGLMGENLHGMMLGTFHGVCARILRREADRLPVDSNFVIFDADDQVSLVKRILKEMSLNDKLYRPTGVHDAISKAKNALLGPEDFPIQISRDRQVQEIYKRYQQELVKNNALDFDDLLFYSANLLAEQADVRERWSSKFLYILVDEFQDTNVPQYTLLRYLASVNKNIFVVGDEDQSIYRWRGADYHNIQRFEQDYPQATKILLEQNYRSTQTVLDAARAVIDRNRYRTPKKLFSDRGKGEKIVLYEAPDDRAEASYVVDTIGNALRDGKKGSDFAVMYRTNAQSRLLEEAFLHASQPYKLVGAQRFYGRREVKDVIAYLRLVQNPDDDLSLTRVINVPPRGIGEKTISSLQATAQQFNLSMGGVLRELAEGSQRLSGLFSGRTAALLGDFADRLNAWTGLRETMTPPELFDRVLEDVDYKTYITTDGDEEEAADRWQNVEELRRIAFEYQDGTLGDFLENIALVSDQDTLSEGVNAPTLLTLHAAKGLEFRRVFLVGLDEGLLPHSRAAEDPEEMAEERRLMYVGLTRAKDKLYLVRADRRSNYGRFEETLPSQFLEDIPQELLETSKRKAWRSAAYNGNGAQATMRSRYNDSTRWQVPPPRGGLARPPAPAVQQRYKPTMRVRHPVWGEGVVLESRIQDDDETVDVVFESVGFKRLAASLANLEIVSSSDS
jgi:DNA helicase-2/ATP-dependent DNA helicase PcrA